MRGGETHPAGGAKLKNMKTTKLLLTAAATIISLSVWANPFDFSEGGVDYKGRHRSYGSSSSSEGWYTLYASLDTQPRVVNESKSTDFDGDFAGGYSVGLSMITPVQNRMPLFVEYGLEFSTASRSDESNSSSDGTTVSYAEDVSYTYLSIPVNVVFQYQVTRDIAIAPYAGFNFKYGLSFEKQCVATVDGERTKTVVDYYDEEDMTDGALKRTLMGNQYGANVIIGNRFLVGVKYQKDLTELRDKLTFENSLSIVAAIRF